MGKYGQAAIEATEMLTSKTVNEPERAWEIATIKEFGKGTTTQKKGCPKDTFLGLCENGLIKNVLSGNYTKSKKNKLYAIRAIKFLKDKPELAKNATALWQEVMGNEIKSHNCQMEVVISLWNEGLIEI